LADPLFIENNDFCLRVTFLLGVKVSYNFICRTAAHGQREILLNVAGNREQSRGWVAGGFVDECGAIY